MTTDPPRLLYGRRRGRRLRQGRQRLLDDVLPRLSVDLDTLPPRLDALFPRPVRSVWLEVGFGGGEHLLAQATAHPDVGIIGCEPFVNGVARLLSAIEAAETPLENIRLYPDDARTLIERLPADSVGRVFVLFPDPWPKSRHHRRRFIAKPQLDALARVMTPGAELRLATDHPGYLRWMLFHCLAHGAFEWLAREAEDWRRRPADWPQTRYEEKAIEKGAVCTFLRFRRRADSERTERAENGERACDGGPKCLNNG